MELINRTNISSSIIHNILRRAGYKRTKLVERVTISYDRRLTASYGQATFKGNTVNVTLAVGQGIATLAHELKHVAQFNSGKLQDDTSMLSGETYLSHWAEIEAREFEARYKGY